MPVLQGRGRGDLVVRIEVETPTRLNARQKELLEAFRETETGEECPESTGFFEGEESGRRLRVWLRNRGGAISEAAPARSPTRRSEEHTSELQSLMRISYAVFCLKKKNNINRYTVKPAQKQK